MKSPGSLVAAAFALAASPTFVFADLLFGGAELIVNTYTTNSQGVASARAVASAADGSFVVVWNSYAAVGGQDGDMHGVFGQRFDSAGVPLGTEFQVNSYTTDTQYSPAVSAAPDASFVVVWSSDGQDGSLHGVFGQRYDSSGLPVGSEFQANTFTTSHQFFPAVTVADDNSFVVVWHSDGQDGSGLGVFGQRYDSAGVPVGSEFQINSYTTANQNFSSVSSAADASFVVVWGSAAQDGSSYGVFGQRFDAAGAPAGTEFQANTYTTNSQFLPAVSSAADASFVVVWGSLSQDGGNYGVFGQRFDTAGAPAGTEFQVNTYTSGDQRVPAVSMDDDGSFVAVWSGDQQDGSSYGVFGQDFDSAGAPAGSEFQLNTYTTNSQFRPSISSAGDSSFVVAWESFRSGSYDVVGRVLCIDDDLDFVCGNVPTTTTTTLPPFGQCASVPVTGCVTGASGSVQFKDNSDDTKDQIKWKLSRGGAVDQLALGDPVGTRTYSLCFYDETASAAALIGSVEIAASSKWASKAPKGFDYKDKAGTSDGVTRAKLKTGAAGKSNAQVRAKGLSIPMPTPIGAEFFDQDEKVIVQLVNDETSTCWSTEFTTSKKNTASQFKATLP